MKKTLLILLGLSILFFIVGCGKVENKKSDVLQNNEEVKEKNDTNEKDQNIITENKSNNKNDKKHLDNSTNSNKNTNSTQNNNSNSENSQQSEGNTDNNPNDTKHEQKDENYDNQVGNSNLIITIDAIKEYYCTDGFELKNDTCFKVISTDALKKYSCDDGTENSTVCKETQIEQIPINKYSGSYESCASKGLSGYNLFSCACNAQGGTVDRYTSGNYSCNKKIIKEVPAKEVLYCVSGTKLNGNKCEKIFSTSALYDLTCPSGYEQVGTECNKYS